MTAEPRPCLLHIPRSGGTSLKELLFDNYGRKDVLSENSRLAETIALLRSRPEIFDNYKAFAIHAPISAYTKMLDSGRKLIFFAVVRNPYLRRFSLYNYGKIQGDFPLSPMCKSLSFTEFLEVDRFINDQCYYFCSSPWASFSEAARRINRDKSLYVAEIAHISELAKSLAKRFSWKSSEIGRLNSTQPFGKVSVAECEFACQIDREDVRLWEWVVNGNEKLL